MSSTVNLDVSSEKAPVRNNRPELSPGPRAVVVSSVSLSGSNDSSATSARARSSCCSPQGPRMLPRSFTRLQSAAVPELPDLAILADALDTALSGRRLRAWSTPQTLVVRGTPAELDGFVGQQLIEVWRRGKFLGFQFERDRMLLNPMLTGRLGLAAPGAKPLPNAAVTLAFGPTRHARQGAGRHRLPGWHLARRPTGCRRPTPTSRCAIGMRRGWASSTSCRRACDATSPAGRSRALTPTTRR